MESVGTSTELTWEALKTFYHRCHARLNVPIESSPPSTHRGVIDLEGLRGFDMNNPELSTHTPDWDRFQEICAQRDILISDDKDEGVFPNKHDNILIQLRQEPDASKVPFADTARAALLELHAPHGPGPSNYKEVLRIFMPLIQPTPSSDIGQQSLNRLAPFADSITIPKSRVYEGIETTKLPPAIHNDAATSSTFIANNTHALPTFFLQTCSPEDTSPLLNIEQCGS